MDVSVLFNPLNWNYEHFASMVLVSITLVVAIKMAIGGIKNTKFVVKQECNTQISHNNEHINLSLVTIVATVPLILIYFAQLIGLDDVLGIQPLLAHLDSVFESAVLYCLLWAIKHIAVEEDPLSKFYVYAGPKHRERRKENKPVKVERRKVNRRSQ